jgi:glycolate dehydrogenase iron-sulfur subunit
MKTQFSAQQLKSARLAEAAGSIRACVQCGLCNATCPTYLINGDERDGPRGRIMMMRDMLQGGSVPSVETRRHLERCLSCQSCMASCPAGVDYKRLIDIARAHMQTRGDRRLVEGFVRRIVASTLAYPERLRWTLRLTPMARRMGAALSFLGLGPLARLAETIETFDRTSAKFAGPGTAAITTRKRARVLLLAGCAQQVLRPDINDATIRLLARRGVEVEVVARAGCCGAIAQRLGREEEAIALAKINVDAWSKAIAREPANAIITNTAACGVVVQRYAQLLKGIPGYDDRAEEIAAMTMDLSTFLAMFNLGPPVRWSSLKVAYLSACTLQHGQRVGDAPKELLGNAGYTVVDIPEGLICCGGAGLAPLLQPEIASELGERKIDNIRRAKPDLVAAGDLACINHLTEKMEFPIVHTVELLDWAYGGPVPRDLESLKGYMNDVPLKSLLKPEDYLDPIATAK